MHLHLVVMEVVDNSIDPTATGLNKVQIASVLIGVILPLIVGLITTRLTASRTKSLLLLVLSAVTALLTEFVNNSNFVWQDALVTTVVTFITGVASLYGLWRPTGVAAKALNTGRTA